MEKEKKYINMEIYMKVILLMINGKDMGNIFGKMDIIMKVNGKMI